MVSEESKRYGKELMREWFIRSAAVIANPDLEILKVESRRITVKCKFCGRIYFETRQRILAGRLHSDDSGCGHKYSESWRFNRTTIDRIVNTLENISKLNKKLNLPVYDYTDKKMTCQCSECGHEFRMSIYDLERNECSCAKCKRIEKNEKKKNEKYNPKVMKKKLTENSNDIKILEYNDSIIRYKCKICNNEYETENKRRKRCLSCKFCLKNKHTRNIPEYYLSENTEIDRHCEFYSYCLINGKLCKNCLCEESPTYLKSEFNSLMEMINPQITLIQDYVSPVSEILYFCENCGSTNSEKPVALINGSVGCPNCRDNFGDIAIKGYLDTRNIAYEIGKVFEVNDVSFPYPNKNVMVDYYLPEYDIAIIYSGKFHFYPWIMDEYDLSTYFKRCVEQLSKMGVKLLMIPFGMKNMKDKLDREINARNIAQIDKN